MSSGLAIDALTDVPDSAPTLSADSSSPDVARVARQAPEVSASSSTFAPTFRSVGEVAATVREPSVEAKPAEKPEVKDAPIPSLDAVIAKIAAPMPPDLLDIGPPPVRAHYSDPDSFDQALEQHGAAHGVDQAKIERHQLELQAHQQAVSEVARELYEERAAKAAEKYPDYNAVAHADDLKISAVMRDGIYASDNGPDIAYYLGKNPLEAKRISSLVPGSQFIEIGRLADRLATQSAASKAIAAKTAAKATAPKSVDELTRMSTTDYAKWRVGSMSRR